MIHETASEIDLRIPDEFGYDCATALGVDAYCPLPTGRDGKVFLVEDDLVMKITLSRSEAAICRLMADRGTGDAVVPGLYLPIEVRSVTLEDGAEAFVILREEISDVFVDPGEGQVSDLQQWEAAVALLDAGWFLQDAAFLDEALLKTPRGAALDGVVTGLKWLRDGFGIHVRDLHLDNFGRRGDGTVCVRDLSRCRMPEPVIAEALSRIEPMPSPAPAMSP